MAQQLLNLGTTDNDGTGTTLKAGGDMINDNFTELYSQVPTATSIGALIGGSNDATPNDTDFVATSLTGGGILKKITWTNVKAFLKTYFDTIYQIVGSYVPYTGATINVDLGTFSLTTPNILGGTSTTADLTLQTTSGIGATGADMHFKVGNNGGTEAMTILNSGNVGIGTTGPSFIFDVYSGANEMFFINSSSNVQSRTFIPISSDIYTLGSSSRLWSQFWSHSISDPGTGNVGIGTTSPTAVLHLKAGTATANTAPLKFTSGTLNTTAAAGAVEFLTDDYYGTITTGAARKKFVLDNGTDLTSGRVPFATTNGRLTDDADFTFATDTLTVTKIGTTSLTGTTTAVGRLIIPMGEISYFNTTGTSITISGTSDGSTNMVVINPATTLNNDSEFDNGGANNGRLRYTGATTKTFHVAVTLSGTPQTTNDVFVFGVAKGGSVIAASKVLGSTSGTQFSSIHVMVSLATNEYLELYVGNTSASRNFTVKSLNIFAMGM